MAAYGLKCLAIAPISAEATNAITYGTGMLVEHLRQATYNTNFAEGKLHGDNLLAEYRKKVIDGDLEIETTELTPEAEVAMGLEKIKTAGSTGTPTVYTMKTKSGTPMGVGFIVNIVINDEDVFRVYWFHKVTLSHANETWKTIEENIDYNTPSVSGKAWPVNLDASGEEQIRDFAEFETETAALAWLKTQANIT